MPRRIARDALVLVWHSNAALFVLSTLAGFIVGSGCILSSDRNLHAPDDFHVVITSSSSTPSEAGRITIDAYGRVRFEDWGAPGPQAVVVEEVWDQDRVDAAYAVFRTNGFLALQQRYPEGGKDAFFDAESKVTVEGVMRGTYQVVHVIRSDEAHLPEAVRNILDWYFGQVGYLRGKVASSVR